MEDLQSTGVLDVWRLVLKRILKMELTECVIDKLAPFGRSSAYIAAFIAIVAIVWCGLVPDIYLFAGGAASVSTRAAVCVDRTALQLELAAMRAELASQKTTLAALVRLLENRSLDKG
jgi:hypothetical protein